MTALGWKIHPTKRDGPIQSIEYIGFLLNLARALLSITDDKRDKLLAHVDLLLKLVLAKKWDIAQTDSVIGKLSSVAPVVQGGRAALAPFYKARTHAASFWSNPFGKTPSGASVLVYPAKHGISLELWEACCQGLLFWKERLSDTRPPANALFIFEDGSLAVWGPDVFPPNKPFRCPRPHLSVRTRFFVSDAASVGWSAYEGLPWIPPAKGSVLLGLWSPEESTWTSNMRESLTLLLAARFFLKDDGFPGTTFVVFISDNTCAVAMASHLHSRSVAVSRVAKELRETLVAANAQSFGYHLPGKLNVYTDRPSRAGERLFEQSVISPALLKWAKSLPAFKKCQRALGALPPLVSKQHLNDLFVLFPHPHVRESVIASAIAAVKSVPGLQVALVLPDAAYSDGRWTPLFPFLTKRARVPPSVHHFVSTVSTHDSLWVSSLTLPSQLPGAWWLWGVTGA
jgi:hypothetical protein